MRLERSFHQQIDRFSEQVRNLVLDMDYVEQRYPAGFIEGGQQIDIGIGAVVTPHCRAE
jgi:hypothetical protein